MSLQELNHKIVVCDHCQLSTIRKYAVIGQGSSSSEMMLIGQSPGKVEDESNILFAGPSGKIFDMLLTNAGITRNESRRCQDPSIGCSFVIFSSDNPGEHPTKHH